MTPQEILAKRDDMLTENDKELIQEYLDNKLVDRDYVVIDGAYHYYMSGSDKLDARREKDGRLWYLKMPYKKHEPISRWLEGLGFHTCRYYNKGGVDNGLKVWI